MYNKKEINKEIYRLIIPMILENILQISAGLISTAMIGRLLASDVSAQGICIRVTDTLWCLYKGISVGATVLIARTYGEGDAQKCKKIAEQTLLTEIAIALFFQIVLFLFCKPVLGFFTKEQAVLLKAQEYMRIIVFGFPFIVVMSVVTATFHGHGNTKTPMFIAIIMNLINIVCGCVFIFGALSIKGMGIRGAAVSLVVAQFSGALIGLYMLYNKNGLLRNVKTEQSFFTLDRCCIREIYTTGIPAALESMFWQFSAIILSKIILSYGQLSFAAYQLGIQAETVTEMPAIGFGTAATTLAARAIGKKDHELQQIYFKQLLKSSAAISICTSLLLLFLPHYFMNMMTNNPSLKAIGALYVFIMGFVQIPQNLSRIYNGTLRAAGYKNIPMYVAGFGIWVIRIPLCLLVAYILKWDILFIWIVIALDQISRFLLSVFVYAKKNKIFALQTGG